MILLSIQGLFRTVLIISGVIVIMRFVGKLMMAKRNVQEHATTVRDQQDQQDLASKAKNNFGKTSLSNKKSTNLDDGDFTPYEEV